MESNRCGEEQYRLLYGMRPGQDSSSSSTSEGDDCWEFVATVEEGQLVVVLQVRFQSSLIPGYAPSS